VELADLRKLGYLPLQHHEKDVPNDLRNVVLAGRVLGLDPLGNRTLLEPGTLGDVANAGVWKAGAERQHVSAWSFAMPSVVAQAGTTGPGQQGTTPPTDVGDVVPTQLRGITLTPGTQTRQPTLVQPLGVGGKDPDPRFPMQPVVNEQPWPKGTKGLTVALVNEQEQELYFFPSPQPTVAVNHAGDPATATLVYDLEKDGSLSPHRKARLHTLVRVVLPKPGGVGGLLPTPEGGSLAWQLTSAGQDGTSGHGLVCDVSHPDPVVPPPPPPDQNNRGNESSTVVNTIQSVINNAPTGAITSQAQADVLQRINMAAGGPIGATNPVQTLNQDVGENVPTQLRQPPPKPTPPTQVRPGPGKPTLASMTARKGGLVEVGGNCQHKLGETEDGENINSAHVSADALFYKTAVLDGPLPFEGTPYPEVTPQPMKVPVHLGWNAAEPHAWPFGDRVGKWRLWAEVPSQIIDGWPPPNVDPPPPPGSTVLRSIGPKPTPPPSSKNQPKLLADPWSPTKGFVRGPTATPPPALPPIIGNPSPPATVAHTPTRIATGALLLTAQTSRQTMRDVTRETSPSTPPPTGSAGTGARIPSGYSPPQQPQVAQLTGYGNEDSSGGFTPQANCNKPVLGALQQNVTGGLMVGAAGYTPTQARNDEYPPCGRHAYITFPPKASRLAMGVPSATGEVSTGTEHYASSSGHEIVQMRGTAGEETGFHARYQTGVQAGFDSSGNVIFASGYGSTTGVATLPEKGSTPSTPPSGYGGFWVKSDGTPHFINDGGVDRDLSAAAGGTNALLDGTAHTDTLAGAVALGDVIHGNATPKWARLAGNTTATKKFLTQTGNGTISAVPAWSALVAGDIPDISASYVPVARTVTATSPITGGGALSSNISIGLGTVGIANGGTGQTGVAAAFDALAPTTTKGDMIYANATPTNTAIAIGNANDILRVASGIPQWCSAATWLAAVGNFTNVASDTLTGSWSTNTTYTILSSRVGDVLKCYLNIKLAGAPTSATLTLNIPGGRTVDTTKLARTAGQNERAYIGAGYDGDTGTANRPTFQLWYDFTNNNITVNYLSALTASAPVGASVTQAAPQTWASGDWMSLTFELPISGWSF
jgi:hypothetical protein